MFQQVLLSLVRICGATVKKKSDLASYAATYATIPRVQPLTATVRTGGPAPRQSPTRRNSGIGSAPGSTYFRSPGKL